jgi:LysM repeat protein
MSDKNYRPEESSKFPYIAVLALVLLIAGMLYGGYEYLIDEAAEVDELITNTPLDNTGKDPQPPATDLNEDVATDTKAPDNNSNAPVNEKIAIPTTPESTVSTNDIAKDDNKKEEKPTTAPTNLGGEETTHTVQAGETFFGIANRYNIKFSTLKALNPGVSEQDVKSGVTKLNVRVQAVHIVGPGDILRVVADKYGITVAQLMAANKKTKNFAERGEKLIIPIAKKK